MIKRKAPLIVGVVLCALIATVILVQHYGLGSKPALKEQKDVSSFSNVVYRAISGSTLEMEDMGMQENGVDYINYWKAVSNAIAVLLNTDTDHTEEAAAVLQSLMGTFERNGYFPRPPYSEYDYGWVSSMDAPLIAVLAQMMYEKTGDVKYQSFVDELSHYMLKDVSDHGYIGQIDGESWLFEYADTNTDKETGLFVLNGSLLGTLGTALIARATENQNLVDLVESQTRLYQQMMPQFWYENEVWCFYALREHTVNPPHYVIFEIELFQALAEVVGEPFYQQEAQRRMDLMKDYYRLYVYDEDDNPQYMFLRSGAPHYYYTDIYQTELVFYGSDGTELKRHVQSGNEMENACMQGEYPEGTERVEWIVNSSLNMGNLQIDVREEPFSKGATILTPQWTASADGLLDADTLAIDSEQSEEERCNLVASFDQPVELLPTQIYGIELENTSDEEFSTNIVIYDSEGNAISRYLKAVAPGKNLVVFSPIGFSEYGQKAIENMASFNLRIYTIGKENVQANLEIGNLTQFDDSYSFAGIYQDSEYKIIDWGA